MTTEPTLIAVDTSTFRELVREVRELRQRVDTLIEPPREWVSVLEAAEHYRVDASTIRRWVRDGRIEARDSGKARRIRVR